MASSTETLPTGENVTVVYLGRGGSAHILYYLHKVRRGLATDRDRDTYKNMESTYSMRLAEFVATAVPDADAIIQIPSSRDDADPYLLKLLTRIKSLENLSGSITRAGKVKAADDDTTVEQLVADLTYRATGKEVEIRSLVILDETYGTGKSVAALLQVLRANGLRGPSECKVTVAVALKVK
jgi:predicted amidophosphoribosyltransferase